MSIIYNDTDEKSSLQRKVLADLRAKQSAKPLIDGSTPTGSNFDDTSEPDYCSECKFPTKSAMWLGLLVVAVIAVFLIVGVL